jgi:hypothetical protein
MCILITLHTISSKKGQAGYMGQGDLNLTLFNPVTIEQTVEIEIILCYLNLKN